MAELRKCPFCGEIAYLDDFQTTPRIVYVHDNNAQNAGYYIICNKCGTRTKTFFYLDAENKQDSGKSQQTAKAKAETSWNRRADNAK